MLSSPMKIHSKSVNSLVRVGEILLGCAADMRNKKSAHLNGETSDKVAHGQTVGVMVKFSFYFWEFLCFFLMRKYYLVKVKGKDL